MINKNLLKIRFSDLLSKELVSLFIKEKFYILIGYVNLLLREFKGQKKCSQIDLNYLIREIIF